MRKGIISVAALVAAAPGGLAVAADLPKEIQPDVTTFCNQATGTHKMK